MARINLKRQTARRPATKFAKLKKKLNQQKVYAERARKKSV